ncbi:MAG: PilN domain-containing protein [Phycisphaerae bacterium]
MTEKTAIGIHCYRNELRRAKLRISGLNVELVRTEAGVLQPASSVPRVSSPPFDPIGMTTTIVSMPGSDIFSRCWVLPQAADDDFRLIITHRLEAEMPVPLDQLTWGYRKSHCAASGEKNCLVFVQAAKSQRIAQQNSALSAAGINVDVLTTEAEGIGALYRHGLQHNQGDGCDVLILADSLEWQVVTIINGMVKSIRRVKAEGNNQPSVLRQCREIIQLEAVGDLRQVLCCAATDAAVTPEMLSSVADVPVVPVEMTDRLSQIGAETLVVFGPAIGLALAGLFEKDAIIPLLRREQIEESPRQTKFHKILDHPIRWSAAAFALLLLAAWIHLGAIRSENQKMANLLDETRRAQPAMAVLEPKIKAMERMEKYRLNVQGILIDLCRALPENIVISSIQISREQKLIIKGTGRDPKSIFTFTDTLRKSNRLTAVNPERTEPGQGGGFTISAELVGVQKMSTINQRRDVR